MLCRIELKIEFLVCIWWSEKFGNVCIYGWIVFCLFNMVVELRSGDLKNLLLFIFLSEVWINDNDLFLVLFCFMCGRGFVVCVFDCCERYLGGMFDLSFWDKYLMFFGWL